jgi:beta-lactamase class A
MPPLTRRAALARIAIALPAAASLSLWSGTTEARTAEFQALERRIGGRLGVAILDLRSGRRLEHRAHERFPMCSTFKLLLAAQVLSRADRGEERLDHAVPINREDMVTARGKILWSPVTEPRMGTALSVEELCAAAVSYSDNTAANILLARSGGPPALTAYARSLGDTVTRLDRIEPDLNEARPGDPRDTTSPRAMLDTLHTLLLGDALSGPSRDRLTRWAIENTTGDRRLRAGLPVGWTVGDKTGTGGNGVANDIAIGWPPSARPVLVTAYLVAPDATDRQRDQVLETVGRIAAG